MAYPSTCRVVWVISDPYGLFTAGGDTRLLFLLNSYSLHHHHHHHTNPTNPILPYILLKNLRKGMDWLVVVVVVVWMEGEGGKKCEGGDNTSYF